jgi:hypothetical protein
MDPRRIMCLAVLLLLAGLPWAAEERPVAPAAPGQLQDRCRQLQLQLVEERLRLLREDSEIAELNRRIQALYQKMDELLASRPSMKRLQQELAAVEKALAPAKTAK